MPEQAVTKRPTDRLKEIMAQPTVREQFQNSLGENSGTFVASLIDLYASDNYLQKCDPKAVVMEALKAATLKLPINKSLGFAYVIPYGNQPQFQLGYKGLLQLAMRTGQYRYINADKVFEGELKKHDKLTGEIELGEPTGNEVVGYFAFLETINGFRKSVYWNKQQIVDHAKRFSKAYNSTYTPWKTDFDAMALKTVLKQLLSKYGIMSVEMIEAFTKDEGDSTIPEQPPETEDDALEYRLLNGGKEDPPISTKDTPEAAAHTPGFSMDEPEQPEVEPEFVEDQASPEPANEAATYEDWDLEELQTKIKAVAETDKEGLNAAKSACNYSSWPRSKNALVSILNEYDQNHKS